MEFFPFNWMDDDDEFSAAIFDLHDTESAIPFHLLANSDLTFSPFEFNDDGNSPLSDMDPDVQYFSTQCNQLLSSSNYYLEDSFNKSLKDLKIPSNCLSLFHSNIRSASKNLNKLDMYLENLKQPWSFIGLSETWFKPEFVDCYGLDNYHHEFNCRTRCGGGGVSLLIRNNIEYTLRKDLCFQEDNFESIFIEIDKKVFNKTRNLIVGVIYRPPDTDIRKFNDFLDKCLGKIRAEKKLSYLMGDYNINIMNWEEHIPTQEFVDLLSSHGHLPYITKPTRVTKTSATLIDNIFSNDLENVEYSHSGILYTDISDHFPVFYIDYSCSIEDEDTVVHRRVYSQENIDAFITKLSNKVWNDLLVCDDVETAYSLFMDNFIEMYNDSFPLKAFKKGYKTKKIWLSEGMKRSIKRKNKLFKRFKRSGKLEHEEQYKSYRNRLNKILSNAQRAYYEKILEENKGNLRKSWQILKDIINRKKQSKTCTRFLVDNSITTDKDKIAQGFNKFYINVGPNLASKIPKDNRSPTFYIKQKITDAMLVTSVDENEVEEIVKSLKDGSAGWDAISSHIVKKTYDKFLLPLTHIMNLSICSGIFPSQMKIARVIPLFKSGDSTLFSNYRPVSVLPLFSKILERLMYKRLLAFVNKHNLLYRNQFGFRANHSPNLALILLMDKISGALERGDYVLGLFLDFSKAFDTVNHEILFEKLSAYGVVGTSLDWFKSYLYRRKQYVEYNGSKSDMDIISCGVPQGSILGPLLFLIYINDLAEVSNLLFALMFADDSNMFLSGKNPDNLITLMNGEMIKMVDWLNLNKLSLNLKKTHFMLFTKKNDKFKVTNKLLINNVIIDQAEKTKFLGVIIDPHLSFQKHISYMKGKIARGIGCLRKSRPFLNEKTLKTLYNAMIFPHFTYCIEVWGNNYSKHLEPLMKLQHWAIHVITGTRKYDHVTPLFNRLKLMTLEKIYPYYVLLLMYKFHKNKLPSPISGMFTRNNVIHDRDLRSKNDLHVPPLFHYNLTNRCVRVTGVKLYNTFTKVLDFNVSYPCFKSNAKKLVLQSDVSDWFDVLE